jgi:hypothetical protein
VRPVMIRPARLVRALLALSLVVVAGCGGGTTGTNGVPNYGYGPCDPQTAVQLAYPNDTSGNPTPTGVSTSIGHLEIVAQSNTTALGQSSASWDTILVPANGGAQISGGYLTITSDPNGPHPFGTDFYWNSSIPTLQPGVLYIVQLNVPSSTCASVTIGQFAT